MKIYLRDLKTHIGSAMNTLTNFVLCCRKVFIHRSPWMARKDSLKNYYLQRRNFAATCQERASQKLTKKMLLKSEKALIYKIEDNIIAYETLLLTGISKSFRKKCLEIYKLVLVLFLGYLTSWIGLAGRFEGNRSRVRIINISY